MAPDSKSKTKSGTGDAKGRKRKQYLPHNRPVKKKGYPLRPGVQGFFFTCDGGRELQASREAINVFDTFYEELGNGSTSFAAKPYLQPANEKIKFESSREGVVRRTLIKKTQMMRLLIRKRKTNLLVVLK